MVDCRGLPLAGPAGPDPRSRAIPPAKKRPAAKRATQKLPARPRKGARKPAPRKAAPRKGGKARTAAPSDDAVIGMALADAYALERLKAPARMKSSPKRAMREIGWATFGEIARQLAARIAKRFRPEAVLGIAKGGVFVGSAVASTLGADFYPVRVESRRRDAEPIPEASEQFPDLKGKRVLVVDDVCQTGATLSKARKQAKRAGAKDVRSATLVVRPGGARPDFSAVETDELVLFGWDYQLDQTDSGHGDLQGVEPEETDPAEVGV